MSPSHSTTRSAELQEDIWRQFDHKLLKLKLDEIRTAFDRAEREGLVVSLRLHLSSQLDLADLAADPKLQIQLGAELRETMTTRVEAELGIVYETYRHVWKLQQKKETPDFLRVVLRKGLLPRLSQMKKKLSDTKFRNLKKEWKSWVEIKARELEHQRSVPKKISGQKLIADRRGRKRDAKVVERDRIIATLKTLLVEFKGTKRDRKIAHRLTEKKIRPPERWGVQSFDDAYRDPNLRKRFAKMVTRAKLT